ncbi:hypothetical protein Amsp01_043440 [Amycolatopsis sp. NBRC 101858]|nr:hypothetical protein Amsp01_043440 [Amycolatopsis sp. NBRC 101858]
MTDLPVFERGDTRRGVGWRAVVASSQTPPLLEQVEPTFYDVAAAIVDRVEGRWAPAACAVPSLVGGFGDHRGDAAST